MADEAGRDDGGAPRMTGPLAALGLDAGSATCKGVAIDAQGRICAVRLQPADPHIARQAEALLAELRAECGAAGPVPVIATGCGRRLVAGAARHVTEITCHARGVFAALGRTGTLVDIGGQDSKVIRIGAGGRALDFLMNDKCAAGTGRFLEHTAARLAVPINELGARALASPGEAAISSTCTVFAESEIVSLLAHGVDVESILRGLHRSLVNRVLAMVHGIGLEPPLMLSGGVARNAAVRAMLAEGAGQREVLLPEQPQLMGAYGAALLALCP